MFGQRDDQVDHRLECLVAEHDSAKHDVLGKLLGFRFHHHDRVLRTGNNEVELAVFASRRKVGLRMYSPSL